MDFLRSLEDYEHVLLVAAVAFAYFRFRKLGQEERADLKAREAEMVEASRRTIKESLSNGIGELVRNVIREHEKVEREHLSDQLAPLHDRLARVEAALELARTRGRWPWN